MVTTVIKKRVAVGPSSCVKRVLFPISIVREAGLYIRYISRATKKKKNAGKNGNTMLWASSRLLKQKGGTSKWEYSVSLCGEEIWATCREFSFHTMTCGKSNIGAFISYTQEKKKGGDPVINSSTLKRGSRDKKTDTKIVHLFLRRPGNTHGYLRELIIMECGHTMTEVMCS